METIFEKVNKYIGYPPEIDEGLSVVIKRKAFIDGYEEGKKDIIEKICAWFMQCNYNPIEIELFKRIMES